MVCPNCGSNVPQGATQCPQCQVAIITVADTKKRKRTATDVVEVVPFLGLGIVLFIAGLVLFLRSFAPAWEILSNIPAIGGMRQLVWVSETRFYMLPVVLEAFSNLMWCLAGLFLILAGILSAVKGKGSNQASGAVVLGLFGLFAQVVSVVIQYSDAIAAQGYRDVVDWFPMALQVGIIVVVLILIGLKKRARKKLRFKQAAEKAQTLQAARAQAAAMGATAQELAGDAAPPPPAQPPASPPADPPQS